MATTVEFLRGYGVDIRTNGQRRWRDEVNPRARVTARPYSFRSSFRDWVEEMIDTPYEVAEMAIGHKAGSGVERAYRRTDYLEKRSIFMQRWADFVTGQAANDLQRA